MATPKNAPYKKRQREAEKRLRQHFVLWTSCWINDFGEKIPVQGTYIRKIHGNIGIDAK